MTYTFPIAPTFPTIALRREIERLFDDAAAARPASQGWTPAVSLREDAAGFTFELDVPGVDPDAVEVVAEDGVLTVRGSRATREATEGEKTVLHEAPRGTFARRFRLPKTADLQAVSATYALGVLTVQVAKVAPAQPRRVPVTVERTPAPTQN